MEMFRIEEVTAAVCDAIERGAIGFDAIKHLVLCRIERRPPRLDMTIYPYLPRATVTTTSAKAYMGLLAGAASWVRHHPTPPRRTVRRARWGTSPRAWKRRTTLCG